MQKSPNSGEIKGSFLNEVFAAYIRMRKITQIRFTKSIHPRMSSCHKLRLRGINEH